MSGWLGSAELVDVVDGVTRFSGAVDSTPTPFCFQQRHNNFNALQANRLSAVSREEWAFMTPQFSAK
jgi:hypothetical protein